MTEKLQQIVKREVARLPTEIQEAINSLDWGNIAEQIGKKYLLSESETNDFQVQTLLVLTGIARGDLYMLNIENEVGTSKDEAEKMAGEAIEKIFKPIKNIMEENIKESLKNKNITAMQNLDFILSGGDYSVFLAQTPEDSPHPRPLSPERSDGGQAGPLLIKEKGNNSNISGYTVNTPPKMMEMKNKFLYNNERGE